MKKYGLVLAFLFPVLLSASSVDWHLLTGNAAYSPRDNAFLLEYNNKKYLIGGSHQDDPDMTFADVYTSFDGIDWQCLTRNAAFGQRRRARCAVWNNKMWLVGGETKQLVAPNTYAFIPTKDVWYSTNGTDWTIATGNAAFNNATLYHKGGVMVYNSQLWVVGINDSYREAWYSNNGSDWFAATRNAAFPGRVNFAYTVFNNKMWVFGGTDDAGHYYNDAWYSTNGADWYATTRNAEWTTSDAMNAFSYNGLLWVYLQNYGQAWTSPDGIVWTLATNTNGYPPLRRESGFSTISTNMISIQAGYVGENDVNESWYALLNAVATSTPTQIIITATNTPLPTLTPTHTITPTRTPSPTATQPTATRTITPYNTFTPSPTITPTRTMTFTMTQTWTITPTFTVTPSFTVTATVTPVETIILWYNSTDTDWHKTDVRISWREYPGNVAYILRYTDIDRPDAYEASVIVPLDDDISPSPNVFTYDLQGLIYDDRYSITITAEGGDDDVHEWSNNIVVCPKASPTAVR